MPRAAPHAARTRGAHGGRRRSSCATGDGHSPAPPRDGAAPARPGAPGRAGLHPGVGACRRLHQDRPDRRAPAHRLPDQGAARGRRGRAGRPAGDGGGGLPWPRLPPQGPAGLRGRHAVQPEGLPGGRLQHGLGEHAALLHRHEGVRLAPVPVHARRQHRDRRADGGGRLAGPRARARLRRRTSDAGAAHPALRRPGARRLHAVGPVPELHRQPGRRVPRGRGVRGARDAVVGGGPPSAVGRSSSSPSRSGCCSRPPT
ncbi:hypothetical protein ACVW07_000950 [Cellulomonas sp. URHB0016]